MKSFLLAALVIVVASAIPLEERLEEVTPEYLNQLRAEGRYAEFEKHMGINIPNLSRPNENSVEDPSMNVELFEGDILLTSEEARQGINFQRYRGSRWPGQPAIVPYTISTGDFSQRDLNTIRSAISEWNDRVACVKFQPRNNEGAYVNYFAGNGCYANMGRTGRQQSISLGRGCVYKGIVWHEMEHSIGISHEHNRSDRDDFVEVLWDNIPDNWKSQYEKNDPNTYGLQANYDYYSVMHYGMNAPNSGGKKAFRILQNGVNENGIGQRRDFTQTDLQKISELYC